MQFNLKDFAPVTISSSKKENIECIGKKKIKQKMQYVRIFHYISPEK